MKKLQELLNKLIELGWKPRGLDEGINCVDERTIRVGYNTYSINDLCSRDSGLWQFVTDNDLYDDSISNMSAHINGSLEHHYMIFHTEFRLMRSSITEDKIEFLLDNIFIYE